MTSLIDRTITALRTGHDDLAAIASRLTPEQLRGGSGAAEWSVAQVFSHLGSGAEIMRAGLSAALGQAPAPEDSFSQSVWDRWNALEARPQADGFRLYDAALVETYESIPPPQREALAVPVGFLPQPMPLTSFAGMRLSEVAQHGWDVRVGLDPQAALSDDEAQLVAEHLCGGLSFFLGFAAKADRLAEPAVVDIAGSGYGLVIDKKAALTPAPADPTATFDGPLESAIRLLAGRLKQEHTPDDVKVTGNVTLDDLRRVFPGY